MFYLCNGFNETVFKKCKGRCLEVSCLIKSFFLFLYITVESQTSRLKEILRKHVGNEDVFYIAAWFLVFIRPLSHCYYEYSIGLVDSMDWSQILADWSGDLMFLILFFWSKYFLEPKYFFKQKIKSYIFFAFLSAFVVMAIYSIVSADYMISQGLEVRGQFLSLFTMALLMLGTCLCFSIVFRSRHEKRLEKDTEAEKIKTELDYLKYQINPHFFMNTLNNIHALVDIDGQLAKDAIIELSRMMRYMLYETSSTTVPLYKELEFHRHFVQLMRLRCDESVKITYEDPDKNASYLNTQVPPLIGIVFIENAFKYGISHRHPSYISVNYSEAPGYLIHFHCQNSNYSQEVIQKKGCGLGIANVRKRLDLIYSDRYKLEIVSNDKDYIVDLYVPLY